MVSSPIWEQMKKYSRSIPLPQKLILISKIRLCCLDFTMFTCILFLPVFENVEAALAEPDTGLRLFGKPRVEGSRRVAVTLARDIDVDAARAKARRAAAAMTVRLA
jgi:hypothetical protein